VERVVRRLGLLGGTFDPIHCGHLVAAEEARSQLDLERVLFVPTGSPPHKPDSSVSPVEHRVRMVELALDDRPHFELSRADVDRPGPSYTVRTLEIVHSEWGPRLALFFIEGADSLADLLTWHKPRRLLELCQLAVVERPGVELDLAELDRQLPGLAATVHWVQMPCLEISSSDLRARVRMGRSISCLVPPAVEAYIHRWDLYRDWGQAPAG